MSDARAPVFVTGGSGFLGRRLIRVLGEGGQPVRALARSAAAREAVGRAGAEAVAGDLDDQAALRAGMAGCAVVYHGAALAEDWGDPAAFHRANVVGTENVLAAARAAGVSRLVHVSTEAVLLGGRPIVNADESWPLPARPIGLYALTKGQAEQRVLAANQPGLATMIVRPRLIWGVDDTTLLPRLCQMARAGQLVWVGGGRHLTSTCHVDNVCEGMILCAERGRGGEAYFLTDGPPVEARTFLSALIKTQGLEPGDRSVPLWLARAAAWVAEAASRTLGVPARPPLTRMAVGLFGEEVTVSDAKARRELGYQARTSIAAGLAAMQAAAGAA